MSTKSGITLILILEKKNSEHNFILEPIVISLCQQYSQARQHIIQSDKALYRWLDNIKFST